jgi:hypothetical protein
LEVAQMGIYLHSLQDRPSHAAYCGNLSGSYMQFLSTGDIQLNYNTNCGAYPHAVTHMQEFGTGSRSLPLRSYTGLTYTFDELVFFARYYGTAHPEWFRDSSVLDDANDTLAALKGALVGTVASYAQATGDYYPHSAAYVSGKVTLPLQQVSGTTRHDHMVQAMKDHFGNAYVPMPGYEDSVVCN